MRRLRDKISVKKRSPRIGIQGTSKLIAERDALQSSAASHLVVGYEQSGVPLRGLIMRTDLHLGGFTVQRPVNFVKN